MSIPTLCPHCDDNHTCMAHVKYVLTTGDFVPVQDGTKQLTVDVEALAAERQVSYSLNLGLPTHRTAAQRPVCGLFAQSIERALELGCKRLTLLMNKGTLPGNIKDVAMVLNCRAINSLAYREQPFSLAEIEIVCRPQDKDAILAGLNAGHPLCPFCFKPSADVIPTRSQK